MGTHEWDNAKLEESFLPLDVSLIKLIHPSVTGTPDTVTWSHTTNGEYSVRSGYNLLRSLHGQSSSFSLIPYKALWKQPISPKIKHFWWRAFHKALPVATNLRKKQVLSNVICQVCGEKEETTNHLLFNCRVSKEIWELAPLQKPPIEELNSQEVIENYNSFIDLNKTSKEEVALFHILGWRIWKQRNDLLFQSIRWFIPNVMNKAIVDLRLWLYATEERASRNSEFIRNNQISSAHQAISQADQYCCFVDASWKSRFQHRGIA